MNHPNDVRAAFSRIAYSGSGEPILANSELASEPLKWLKYLVMARVGLESISKISQQIQRFRLPDTKAAAKWAHSWLTEPTENEQRQAIIKVVPWDIGAQLINYRISEVGEIDPVFAEVGARWAGIDHEIWCCGASVGTRGFNLGGRLTHPAGGRPQLIELVWYGSPRNVESALLPGFHLPYLRASRLPGALAFDVEAIRIPDRFAEDGPWLADFHDVLAALETRTVAIQDLVPALNAIGAREVCFCFKISDGRLTVIDWDTEIESSAGDRLLRA